MLIKIILISNDQDYSYAVLTDLSAMGRKFTVSEMGWGENLPYDFEFALAGGNYRAPTIVMLDFNFSERAYTRLLERIDSIKEIMAIECIALRPPVDPQLFADLRRHGLPIFDGAPVSQAAAEAIH